MSKHLALAVLLALSCSKSQEDVAPVPSASTPKPQPQPAATTRPGMAWIPGGTLKAGTPSNKRPRIADEELPGTELKLDGFYIDLLPYPNESGAIPTSNVTRDEAQQLCEQKSKRLCTELEWERACKGDANTAYEYGDDYRGATCGTGVTAEEASKRPSGDRPQCKSAFGVLEMHGGAWEWTASKWGRGSTKNDLGVLRGGNAQAGELVGRCANGLARSIKTKSPTMGFRCCAGPKNEAEVDLALTTGPTLQGMTKTDALKLAPLLANSPDSKIAGSNFAGAAAWRWRPMANETLIVLAGCTWVPSPGAGSCALGILRDDDRSVVTAIPTDRMIVDVAQIGERRKIRALGFDNVQSYVRELHYNYGSVEIGEKKR